MNLVLLKSLIYKAFCDRVSKLTVTFLDTGITESSTKARCEGNYAKKGAGSSVSRASDSRSRGPEIETRAGHLVVRSDST